MFSHERRVHFLHRHDVVQRAHERELELRPREPSEMREPHAIEPAEKRREDENAVERASDRRRRARLAKLRLHE